MTSNAPNSPQTFSIAKQFDNIPVQLGLVVYPSDLFFPTQLVGTSSQPETVTITNVAATPSTLDSIGFVDSTSFTQTNNCPALLPPAAQCTVQVTYSPTSTTAANGDLAIIQDSSPARFDVTTGGTAVTNALSLSTASIGFGSEFVGSTYPSRTIVATNVSPAPLTVSSITLAAPFQQTNNCTTPLNFGASCSIQVSFNPTANGIFQGSVTISHNSEGGPQTIQMFGTGVLPSDLSVSPVQLLFLGNVIIGMPSQPQTIMLQNTSTSTMTFSGFAVTPSTVAISANTCPGTLPAGGSCAVTFVFTPTAAGQISGSFTINHSGAGNPQVLPVSGTAVTQLLFSPASVQFGDQVVGTTGTGQGLSIGNNFNSPVTVQTISVSGDFQITQDPCPLAPAQFTGFLGCAVQFSFTPSATGTRTGIISVVASDSPSPHQIPISGKWR